jgi:flagellar basal body-associated protein FliL
MRFIPLILLLLIFIIAIVTEFDFLFDKNDKNQNNGGLFD